MLKINLYKGLCLCLFLALFSACDNGLEELNVNPNEPTTVPAQNLLTEGQYQVVDRLWGRTLNAEWGMLMVQQWAQNEYTEESRYSGLGTTSFNTAWIDLYANGLAELQGAKDLINQNENIPAGIRANQLAILDIMMAYSYHNITDMWGDVPMSQALNSVEFPLPGYDKQSDIYANILTMLQGAVSSIDEGAGSFSSGDIIFGGNAAKWKKLANSLIMRVAMRMIDTDQSAAASSAISSANGGAFGSNADNAMLVFDPAAASISNPLFKDNSPSVDDRDDFAVSEYLVSLLTDMGDPRLDKYADTLSGGIYVGMPYGLSDADATALKGVTSRPNPAVRAADAPAIIMDYAEVAFIRAEAMARGILSGSAADAYADGVRASMNYWGIADDAAIDAYIAANPYNAADWKTSIGMQKYLAFYMNGPQAWAEQRRLDVPALSAPALNSNGGVIPVRLPYASSEESTNGSSLSAVTTNPGDLNTKMWWDVN